ncbi:MAG: hypothetical protein R3A48_04055 [Polyangiales bacterium]
MTAEEITSRAADAASLTSLGVTLVEDLTAENLHARLAAAPDEVSRIQIALSPEVLKAAARLKAQRDLRALAALRQVVKSHRVALPMWDEGVLDALVLYDEETRQSCAEHAAIGDAVGAAGAEALASKRREVSEEYTPYIDAFTAPDGHAFEMEPGRLSVIETRKGANGPPGHPRVRPLANAAGRIIAKIEEHPLPGVPGIVWCRVGFALKNKPPFTVDVRADEFDAMKWIPASTAKRVYLMAGHDTPGLMRLALDVTGEGTILHRRYGYLGWTRQNDRWMKLHAGGAIDANGVVPDVDVRVGARLSRFRLPPPPTDTARREALALLAELVSLTPSPAVLPTVSFVVRSLLGPGAGIFHLHAQAGLGKSHLQAMASCLAGDFDGPKSLPSDWDRDTDKFIAKMLSQAGDVPLPIDDWRPIFDPGGAKFHAVARALFNMSGRGALARDRSFNETPEPRGAALSNGEAMVLEGSWSGLSRVLMVELSERVALPDGIYAPTAGDDGPQRAFTIRAPAGLAAAGALLVQWLASRLDTWRDPTALDSRTRLAAAERAALVRWGVRQSARAVDVLGPTALGAAVLFDFLSDQDALTEHGLAELDARLRDAFGALDTDRTEILETHLPGRVWVDSLAALLRAGACHIRLVHENKSQQSPPPFRRALGWHQRGAFWEGQGPCVGHLIHDKFPGAICVDAGVALDLMRRENKRNGRATDIPNLDHLSRELVVADLLAFRENAKRAAVRPRIDGAQVPRLALRLSALGIEGDGNETDDEDEHAVTHREPSEDH